MAAGGGYRRGPASGEGIDGWGSGRHVRRGSLFSGLPISVWRNIVHAGTLRPLGAGEFVCHQGTRVRHVYMVVRGRLGVARVTLAGEEVILRFHAVGDTLAWADAMVHAPAAASIQALEASAVLAWDRGTFLRLMRRYPRLMENVAAVVVKHNHEIFVRLEEALTERIERRLARALQQAVEVPSDDGDGWRLHLTERQIAEYVGTSPYTVSRILSRWRRAGVVETHRGSVLVVAPAFLTGVADRFGRL